MAERAKPILDGQILLLRFENDVADGDMSRLWFGIPGNETDNPGDERINREG